MICTSIYIVTKVDATKVLEKHCAEELGEERSGQLQVLTASPICHIPSLRGKSWNFTIRIDEFEHSPLQTAENRGKQRANHCEFVF